MSVNLHDLSYELQKALRESDEYKNLVAYYDAVNKDESANQLFTNFRDIQVRLQQKQMSGQEIAQEEVQQAQKAAALVQQNPKIAKLMQAEQQLSMVIADLNKIIMKPLEELYGPMGN
ncbi:YlbF family regulator [Falsibacillus pallidus]|uniref:YlbF family regulator n=1 Tax=Falsibacillus pallidus TaxID=493781 RepID=UPI003D996A71